MKTTNKIAFLAAALFAITGLTAKAQTSSKNDSYGSQIRYSIGADAGIPVGSFNTAYNWSIGGSIQADFPIVKDQVYATANAGFNNFFANDAGLNDVNTIPVKLGLKYFPVKYFYVQGEAGAAFISNKASLRADKTAVFVYAPQVGTLIGLGGRNYLDIGARFEGNTKFYNAGSSANFVALRVAYAFGL